MATEPKKPAAAGRAAGKTTKAATARSGSKAPDPMAPDLKAPDLKAPDPKAVESRLSALESGLEAAETRLAQQTAALETRIGAVEGREAPAQRVKLPEGVPEGLRQVIDRAAELVRHNPITALVLIVAFLLVAIFS